MYKIFQIFFDNQAYEHCVNLTKININNKTLYLSTGHSFPELRYRTDNNIDIYRTTNIYDTINHDNKYYSIDDNFNDFSILSITSQEPIDYIDINNIRYHIIGICKNTNIKFLENEILLKNSFFTGLSFTKPLINFETDNYIESVKNNNIKYYTFKINDMIVIISTPYNQGIIVKGCFSNLDRFNGMSINQNDNNKQMEYYFNNIISTFKNHELFNNQNNTNNYMEHFNYYRDNNFISIVSLMGDSGAGFFRMIPNSTDLETVGINICGCSIIILSKDHSIDKIKVGDYYIEELHKGAQLLSINMINNLLSQHNITIK